MVATGEFNLGKTLHTELAWYTFSPLLQYELDQVKLQWNTHHIRKSRHNTIPGRPDELFFLPELSGGQNQGTNISSDSEIDSAYSEEENLMEDATIVMNDADEELVEYFEYVVQEDKLLYPPTNWKEERELFIQILERSNTKLIKNVFVIILYFCIACIS